MHPWIGKRLRVRAMEPADVEEFIAYARSHNEEERDFGEGFINFPESDVEIRAAYERALEFRQGPSRGWTIETHADRRPVGGMTTLRCDARAGTFEYGVTVFPEHRRQGCATEAINILVAHYFGEHRFQKVNVRIHEFNEASIALHEKLGFQLEGRCRRALFTKGQHFDELWYGLTNDEFWARNPL